MRRDVVVVGASAGGVDALRALVAGLPADLPATVVVAVHIPADRRSELPAILSRAGRLPAAHPNLRQRLVASTVWVAPPGHHLVVVRDEVRVTGGQPECGHRPSVDVLFRAAARTLGSRVVGVVLSGANHDGAAGLACVAAHGGTTIVQDPAEARFPWMPAAALRRVAVDHVAPASRIGGLIGELCVRRTPPVPPSTVPTARDRRRYRCPDARAATHSRAESGTSGHHGAPTGRELAPDGTART